MTALCCNNSRRPSSGTETRTRTAPQNILEASVYILASSARACVKKEECSHFFFSSHFFFLFTFEQEIVFIVSVPHSRRGRSNAWVRKRMCEEFGSGLSLYARKIWERSALRLCASFGCQGELAAEGESSQLCRGRGGAPARHIAAGRGRSWLGMPAESSRLEPSDSRAAVNGDNKGRATEDEHYF